MSSHELLDPFDLLGVPAAFNLDTAALDRAYLQKSAVLHPDIARGDDDAARRSAELNAAKRVLDDSELRANALLARLGGPGKEQDRSLPPEFLMKIMEIREQIEAAAASQDPAEHARWRTWAANERARHLGRIGALFRGLSTPPTIAALRELRTELNAWRYIERLVEQLGPVQER